MSINKLPDTITKDVLLKYAQDMFQQWIKEYADQGLSAQYMYEDMCCSIFSGEVATDFPNTPNTEPDDTIRYQYRDGACYFIVNGIEVDVLDLRDMRKASDIGIERYVDICIPSIMYKDEDGSLLYHLIPGAWLYGSTTSDFNKGEEVHQQFIDAAKDYIKAHHITKEMQEVD